MHPRHHNNRLQYRPFRPNGKRRHPALTRSRSHALTFCNEAVVIGISDYQDEQIPDLRFADRDAEAFAQWLRSPAGGSLPDAQVKVLTNKNATTGKMIAALDGLIVASKPGDEAIIYFSGHGDVERVTKFQR
ncbi:MAG: caspase family protein, partial [Saprospiraceae bacterium]|nr:caspase family protein [Saprospiraceae bacterium]